MLKKIIRDKQFEQWALEFLERRGLILAQRNYRCAFGEVDLIMQDQNILVFIEVRYRKHSAYGHALETIDHYKRCRIIKTAQHYVMKHCINNVDIRFDAVSITGNKRIDWISHAFDVKW